MKVKLQRLAAALSLALAACGGGGGGDSPQNLPASQASDIHVYAGNYVGNYCSLLEGVVNLEFQGDVIGCFSFSVEPLTDKSARFSYRVDFYDGYYQNSPAIGSFSNNNPDNRVEIIGASTAPGWRADAVRFVIHPPAGKFLPGNFGDRAVFGSAIRLAMPLKLFQTLEFTDHWRQSGGQLLVGLPQALSTTFFPGLASYSVHVQVPDLPPVPPAPCPATPVEWLGSTARCSAQVPASPSGSYVSVRDEDGVTTGFSGFMCNKGVWEGGAGGSCADLTPPGSVVLCPERTWEWTVNGNTCRGSSPAIRNNDFVLLDSVVPRTQGIKVVQCVQLSDQTWTWSDVVGINGAIETCDAQN
jgi:hypothetical protein